MDWTRRERNEIFEALQARGVDPADCEFATTRAGKEFPDIVFRHTPTNSWLELFLPSPSARCYYFNGHVHDGPSPARLLEKCDSWADVLERVGYWADEVRYVAETPDLWAELKQVPEVMAAAQSAEFGNAPFTPDEQAEIARRIDEVKQLVREKFELTTDQLAAIDQRLDDTEEAARHSDRKTWLYTFYGAVMSTFMTDEIPPQVIQTVVSTVLHGIAHIFGIGGPPPIIGT